jgi:hypothetical protein
MAAEYIRIAILTSALFRPGHADAKRKAPRGVTPRRSVINKDRLGPCMPERVHSSPSAKAHQ